MTNGPNPVIPVISLSDREITGILKGDWDFLGFSGIFWGYRGKLPYSFSRWLPFFSKVDSLPLERKKSGRIAVKQSARPSTILNLGSTTFARDTRGTPEKPEELQTPEGLVIPPEN